MSEHYLLAADGHVERRPDAGTKTTILDRGGYAISRGQLCTACLMDSTPTTTLQLYRTLCDECARLEVRVGRLAGLPDTKSAGQWGGVVIVEDGAVDDGGDREPAPVRRARAYRATLLTPLFLRARGLGIVVLEESRYGGPPVELVDLDDVRAHGLVPATTEARIGRYGEWLRALDPDRFAACVTVLADVEGLASWLREITRNNRRAQARIDLDRAARDVSRVPGALISAVSRVVRAGRRVG